MSANIKYCDPGDHLWYVESTVRQSGGFMAPEVTTNLRCLYCPKRNMVKGEVWIRDAGTRVPQQSGKPSS